MFFRCWLEQSPLNHSFYSLHYEKFADGTIKCIEDEIPFELPDGWAWSRFSSAFIINPRNNLPDETEVSFIPMPLIKEGYANNHTGEIKLWKKVKSGFTHFAEKDIGVAKITPCFENKKSVVFNGLKNGFGAGTTELHIIRIVYDTINPEYVLWNIKTDAFISNGVNAFSGAVGQKRIGKDFVENSLIPIPPRNEQNRIIDSISITFAYIDAIDSSKEEFKFDLRAIKEKILDLAIRGKLVPQNPEDEPASLLLERIRVEKEELIKAGKIKRDKKESVIFKGEDNSYYRLTADKKRFDAEIPFEIPKNWCWTTLPSVASVELGKTLDKAKNTGSYYPYLRSVNVQWGYIDLSDLNEMKFEEHEIDKYSIKRNDLLICEGGDVGRCCIWERKDTFLYQNALHRVRFYADLEPRFYLYVMMLYESLGILKNISTGVTIKHLTGNVLSAMPVPLPPLADQKQIVEAIETAFAQLDEITNAIS